MCGTCGWHQLGKNISGLHVLWLKMVGWQHSDCFTSNFIQNIHPETTAVLVCDSHNSYIGVGLVENARKYNIVPLKLPSNCLCILFSTKIPIMWIFCISGWLAIRIILDKWSSTLLFKLYITYNTKQRLRYEVPQANACDHWQVLFNHILGVICPFCISVSIWTLRGSLLMSSVFCCCCCF